jgi:predicted lipid carrier protein YhbT
MKVSFPHGTTKTLALDVLKASTSRLMARFGSEISSLQQEWQEDELTFSFRARGFDVEGMLNVGDEQVDVELNLPQLARLFEGQIRDRVTRAMQEIFEPRTDAKEHP